MLALQASVRSPRMKGATVSSLLRLLGAHVSASLSVSMRV